MNAPPERGGRPRGRRLPHGRHDLPGEVVRDDQRKRLVGAMAELCAKRGYANTSVADVVEAATVSKRTFYEIFESKEDCLIAAYGDYRHRLFEAIDRNCAETADWALRVRETVREILRFFSQDLAGTQLLCTAVLCAADEGLRLHYETVDSIAGRIAEASPSSQHDLPDPERGAVVLCLASVSRAAVDGDPGAVRSLEGDLTATVLALTGSS